MTEKNQIVEIEITAMSTDGSGIGKTDGIVVFVPFTAIGDRLLAKIVKVEKRYCYGIVQELLHPSPARVQNTCPVYEKCGGCALRHVSYAEELVYKQEFVRNNFAKLGDILHPVEPTSPSPLQEGYRNKAQYPIRMENGRVVIGFFAKRSHRVQECLTCALQPAFFASILQEIQSFLQQEHISIYNEEKHSGLVRHVYLRYGEVSGQVMVCLVINGDALPKSDSLMECLRKACPQITTFVLNINKDKTNVILGKKCIPLLGNGVITDTLCGIEVQLSPLSFYQVNRQGAENLYQIAARLAELQGNEVLLDLYCGAGTIGLAMAHRVKQLIGVEVIPQAVENAKANAKVAGFSNTTFLLEDAGGAALRLAQQGIQPNVIVLDPPRKGCTPDVLQAIIQMNPQKVVMISCNSATAARDCKELVASGYSVQEIVPVDMFARTGHVETCVLLSHKNS